MRAHCQWPIFISHEPPIAGSLPMARKSHMMYPTDLYKPVLDTCLQKTARGRDRVLLPKMAAADLELKFNRFF